jgi:hypothetical protein
VKTNGPGKYDAAATVARESTRALGVVLMVWGGVDGSGFSVQVPADILITLPEWLRETAAQIERQLKAES